MDDDKAVGMTTDAKPQPLTADELVKLDFEHRYHMANEWLSWHEEVGRLLATIANITQQRDGWEGAAQGFEKRAVDAEATIAQQAEQIAELQRAMNLAVDIAFANGLSRGKALAALNHRGENE